MFGAYSNVREARRKALAKLGGKCNHPGCTWDHPDVLQIDHILPVRANKVNSYNTHRRIAVMEHPENEFQILCANHHCLKTVRDREEMI